MEFTVFRGLVGGLAWALAAWAGSPAYASTLNHDLQIALDPPQPVVSAGNADSVTHPRGRATQVAQVGKPASGLGTTHQPTPAEIVGRSLNPGASDPDVPLPHPGLSEEFSDKTDGARPLTGPTPFGRGETGGGILGLRLPLPAGRADTGGATTSSVQGRGTEVSPERFPIAR